MIKTVSVLGCGWFGLPFAKALLQRGFLVKGSTTSEKKMAILAEEGIRPFLINTDIPHFDADFFDCDVLLVNIPPKKLSDDVAFYATQIKAVIKQAELRGVKQVIFISSTGVFEDGNKIVDESSIPKPNTPAGLKLQLAEKLVFNAPIAKKTVVRFAGLIGPERNLAKFFDGKTAIANGLAVINLVHLQDTIGFCMALLEQPNWHPVYHAVAPSHPTRSQFYTALCQSSGMVTPQFLMEKIAWKQVDSLHHFYSYQIVDWMAWATNYKL